MSDVDEPLLPPNRTVYFGESDGAPIYDGATQHPTPLGWRCYRCDMVIEDGDRGFIRPMLRADEVVEMGAVHRECELAGLVGHSVGVCRCTGWNPYTRETGLEVQRRVDAGGLRMTEPTSDEQPSITCPECKRTSYNPNDIREGYCGACHDYTSRWPRHPGGIPVLVDESLPPGVVEIRGPQVHRIIIDEADR